MTTRLTTRMKTGLTVLGALALSAVIVGFLHSDGPGEDSSDLSADADYGEEDQVLLAADGTNPDPAGRTGVHPGLPGRGGSVVGARQPHGIDLSDPAVRRTELTRLMALGDWLGAAKIVALMTEPIPAELRPTILWELSSGKRLQVMHIFRELRDPSFVEDLFDLLDNPESSKGARKTALEALWQMPGAPADAVALRLESRLSNDMNHDRSILFAIAARGGTEAARALVEYIQSAKNPRDIPPHVLQRLDVRENQEAARVLADALSTETDGRVLRSLIKMAAQNGARAFSEVLIGLDRDGMSKDVRTQSLYALSQIGDERAIGYLLKKAGEPGQFGEAALRSVAAISSADPAAREEIVKALARADKGPRPELTKESLLLAIGRVGDKKAISAVAHELDAGSPKVRRAAVRAMGRLGPAAEAYVPKLSRAFDDGDEQTRMSVAMALGSIGGQEAVVALSRMLKLEGNPASLQRTLSRGLRTAKSNLPEPQ